MDERCHHSIPSISNCALKYNHAAFLPPKLRLYRQVPIACAQNTETDERISLFVNAQTQIEKFVDNIPRPILVAVAAASSAFIFMEMTKLMVVASIPILVLLGATIGSILTGGIAIFIAVGILFSFFGLLAPVIISINITSVLFLGLLYTIAGITIRGLMKVPSTSSPNLISNRPTSTPVSPLSTTVFSPSPTYRSTVGAARSVSDNLTQKQPTYVDADVIEGFSIESPLSPTEASVKVISPAELPSTTVAIDCDDSRTALEQFDARLRDRTSDR